MFSYSGIAHKNLEICSPVPWETYRDLLCKAKISPQPKMVDIGCGKGGILAKAIETFGGHGIGIDLKESLATTMTPQAEHLRDSGKLEIILDDAKSYLQGTDQKFDLVLCIGSSQALGGPREIFEWVDTHLMPSGRFVFAEIVWKSKPSKDFLEFLECSEPDQFYSAQLFELAQKINLVVCGSASCSDADFENYERELKTAIESWVKENEAHPDAEKFQERSNAWSEAREKWAREAFGFQVMVMGKA